MTGLPIENYRDVYSEAEVFTSIQLLLKKDYTPYAVKHKRYLIADLIKHIDSERLLSPTLQLLEELEFFPDREFMNSFLIQTRKHNEYSEEDFVKIKALSWSEYILYCLYLKDYPDKSDFPELLLEAKKLELVSNLEEIVDKMKRNSFMQISERNEKLPLKERQNDLKTAIRSLTKMDYENGTDFFKKEKEFLTLLKDNIVETPSSVSQPQPENKVLEVFKGQDKKTYTFFLEYLDLHIIEPYVDLSFLYQQLKADALIHPISHTAFMHWLKENDHINQKVYDNLIEYGHFRSLRKSTSNQRLNNYTVLKEKHL